MSNVSDFYLRLAPQNPVMYVMPKNCGLLLLLLLIAVTSCEDIRETEDPQPIDPGAVQECFTARQHDSLAVLRELRGEWRWLHRGYGMIAAPLDDESDAGLVVNFVTDALLVVDRPGLGPDSLPYAIRSASDGFRYDLTIDSEVSELGGRVNFCGNFLVASYGYLDGLTNVFIRPD